MVVYNCSNNSIILSGLRTRLSASFTLKSFTPSFPRPLSPSRFLFFPPPLLLFLSLFISRPPLHPSCGFFLLLPRFDPLRASPNATLSLFPLSWSIINPSIPSRSFHPHIIRACTHAGSSAPTIPTAFAVCRLESLLHD